MGQINTCATSASTRGATGTTPPPSGTGFRYSGRWRCVLVSRLPDQVPGFQKWIEEHKDRYTLKDVRRYPATRGSAVEPAIFYVVCEFVPSRVSVAAGVEGRRR